MGLRSDGQIRGGAELRCGRAAAFTVVELLAVTGILSVLVLAAVLRVQSLGHATARQSAVNSIMNTIEGARALAITNGRPTFLAFADEDAPSDYAFRAYAVFQASEDFGASNLQVTKWEKLPRGVSFRVGANNPMMNAASAVFPMPGQADGADCPFVQFDSRGSVQSPTNGSALRLVLFEGMVEGGVENAANGLVEEVIEIARLTGRANYRGNGQ